MSEIIAVSSKSVSGVAEWADHSVNIQIGCEHDCKYCYAKSMSVHYGRSTPESWATPCVNQKKVMKGYRKREGRIMFPTSHDITPSNLDDCLTVLGKLAESGNDLLIVSKPHLVCIKAVCEELRDYKDQVTFRFTIGSSDDVILKFWEPNAPKFRERLDSLIWAHKQGFATSVSCEPMLDVHIDRVIHAVRPYVSDTIWLGRVNNFRQAIGMNCPDDAVTKAKAEELLAGQTDDFLRGLYNQFKADPKMRFKDSIKKVVGIERPTVSGLDV